MPQVRHMAIEFILFTYYITRKHERQLILNKSNWHKAFSYPVTRSTVGSREDLVVHVIATVSIFYGGDNINSIDSRAMLGHGCSYDVGSF